MRPHLPWAVRLVGSLTALHEAPPPLGCHLQGRQQRLPRPLKRPARPAVQRRQPDGEPPRGRRLHTHARGAVRLLPHRRRWACCQRALHKGRPHLKLIIDGGGDVGDTQFCPLNSKRTKFAATVES